MVLGHFDKQLAQGMTAEALAAHWREAVPFPALLKLNEPSLLTLYSLPQSVADLIVRAVRRTRLWRREQIDVAGELISHFQDGIDAGVSESQLIQAFGDLTTASRLIRRAKVRNRPLLWRTFRRTYQFLGLAILVLFTWWLWLWVRYQFAKPNVTYDYVEHRDAQSNAIPESDRAWPFYAKAITKSLDPATECLFPAPAAAEGRLLPEWQGLAELVDVQRVNDRVKQIWIVSEEGVGAPPHRENVHREYKMKMDAYFKALDELRQSAHWPALVQIAEMNKEAIQLVLKGATKRHLGFIFRDPANATWLDSMNQGSYEHFEESSRSLLNNVLLPHVQALYSINRLLFIECERAIESGDRERVVEILSAYLSISAQIYHSDEFAVEKLSAISFSKRCWFIVRKILKDQPQFFTDGDLRDLAHRMAGYRSDVGLQIPVGSKRFFDDLLQRLYTDDGHGNGYLTAAGTLLLIEQVGVHQGTSQVQGREWNGPFPLTAPLVSGVTVSRAELKQVLDHCSDLDEREASKPLWETDLDRTPASVEYLRQITSTTTGRIKYGILLSSYPFRDLKDAKNSYSKPSSFVLCADSAKMLSDATLVAIAAGSLPPPSRHLAESARPVMPRPAARSAAGPFRWQADEI